MNFLRTYGNHLGILSILCLSLIVSGCMGSFTKKHTDEPLVDDPLTDGTSIGNVENGEFTEEGWMPGKEGRLTYELPVMTQGMVSFDVQGLNRKYGDEIFLTMYEPTELGEYADPYVLLNPYRVALWFKKFETSPNSPFELLWTIKQFSSVEEAINRFVEGVPEDGEGYEETLSSKEMPIYLGETYRIQLVWRYGKAKLFVNDQLLIQHDYAPLIFSAKGLRVVLGKSPGMGELNMPGLTFSNVKITYPNL